MSVLKGTFVKTDIVDGNLTVRLRYNVEIPVECFVKHPDASIKRFDAKALTRQKFTVQVGEELSNGTHEFYLIFVI